MGQKIATLSIGLEMATGSALAELNRFGGAVDSTTRNAIRELDRIDAAMNGIGMDKATASAMRLAEEMARTGVEAARAADRAECAGERMVAQLDRQIETYGLTRSEVRALRAEETARDAERTGAADIAATIRAKEAQLVAMQAATERAAAEERARADATVIAQLRERERLEAALARTMGMDRPRATDPGAGATFSALAARAAEEEAEAIQKAANAYQAFEAAARRGMAVWREQQAVEAAAVREADAMAAAANRLRASIDPTYAAQQRFNQEIGSARKLISAGAISLDEYVAKLRMEQAVLDNAGAAHGRFAAGMNANRQAMAGASYQVQDFFTQVSMGANPVNAFAVQGAQLAGQLSMVEGTAGNVARFFMGPWGLGITAGLLVLSPMLGELLKTNDALGDAIKKLKDDADAARIAEQATQRFANTVPGLTQAIHDQNVALKASQEASVGVTERANAEAKARAALALGIREQTVAMLEEARGRLAVLSTPGASDARLAPARDEATAAILKLEESLAAAKQRVAEAKEAVDRTRVDLATEAAKRATDPIERIKYAYEGPNGLITQAKRQALAEGDVNAALTRRLALLSRQEQAEIAAAQRRQEEARRAVNDNRQSGRQISLSDAENIVRGIGGIITSTTRTFDQQRVLYERYLAGRGPLAARPGTSDHETGNALDIAKTGGITAGRIREAFREQGVAVKQLLDEGRHFHVSWAKGADDAAVASKRLADSQLDLARKFDPATAAGTEYEKTLAAIAAAKLDPATAGRYADAARDAFVKARAAAFDLPSIGDITADQAARDASAKAAADFQANVIKPLQDELALYGLVGPAREAAALALEQQAFVAKNMDQGLDVALDRWRQYFDAKKALIDRDTAAAAEADALQRTADQMSALVEAADRAGYAMERAFGRAGGAIGQSLSLMADYQRRSAEIEAARHAAGTNQDKLARADHEAQQLQLSTTLGLIGATKGLFSERSKGYAAMEAAEKALTIVQLARTAIDVAGGAAKMFASLGPFAFPAVAAMLGVMAGLGFTGGTSSSFKPEEANKGTGSILGDPAEQSESIRRGIDMLHDVDTLTLAASREMANHLRSIDNAIGGVAAQIVRGGDVGATAGIVEGFQTNAIGSVLKAVVPIFGNALASLFGSKTEIVASGLYGRAQSVGDILETGYDAQTYADTKRTSKFLGITTGTKYGTQYGEADAALERQFGLILGSFAKAIGAAAGPLGEATDAVLARVNAYVVDLGKVDLRGLTGTQIEERLSAIFGKAADGMAAATFPGLTRFQHAGEGMYETLIRVSSTVEAVTASFEMLGRSRLGIDASIALAERFDSVSDLTSAQSAYFDAFYDQAEQASARTTQMTKALASMGLVMPASLAGYRALVEAQNLTTDAGRATYASLIQLAPAFADLQSAMGGAKSAADIAAEREGLQRKLLEIAGDEAALRALDLAKLDVSNRALQQQVWAAEAAKEAASKADELRKAWTGVGDSIMDEVRRIRGIDDAAGPAGFRALQGQFNASTAAARAGDMDAAKILPGLSKSLLDAAAGAATSRQELERVRALAAASLENTYAAIGRYGGGTGQDSAAERQAAAMANAATSQAATASASNEMATQLRALRDDLNAFRNESMAGAATIARNTRRSADVLENVSGPTGGNAFQTEAA